MFLMKLLILITLFIPLLALANQDDCNYQVASPFLGEETQNMIETMGNGIKRDFKRRPIGLPLRLALSIETNFEAPLLGNDIYWGRIYVKDGEDKNIHYRDDLLAEDNYKNEQAHPNQVSNSIYKVSDINSAAGLSLIKAAGAEVNVKAVGKFTPSTGGRLIIKVKAPSENPMNVMIDVVNTKGKITNFLIVNNKRIAFDSFKINASTNFFGVTTILSGIDNIQFTSGGKVIHTIKP
jgi:hypothetical protein